MKLSDEQLKWLWEKSGQRCVKNMKKRGFEAYFVPDVESARTRALDFTTGCETFGFGGSATTRELGLVEMLKKSDKIIYDHWVPGLTRAQDLEIRLAQGRCDCFLCSANAVAETGEIVNVDGIGNRTAAMTFGPEKVLIIAGMNKVAPDLDAALVRIREKAAPMRAKSLETQTPCAETGVCSDCRSPQRICNITTILHYKPRLTQVAVILVNQAMGF